MGKKKQQLNWIDFQAIADDAGLKSNFLIDAIKQVGNTFDVSYTDPESGNTGVIRIGYQD
jgi:hypothetical protein